MAMINAISTSTRKSFDKSVVMSDMEAPSTFLMPISLILFSAIYVAKPKSPRQEIKMVKPANNAAKVPVLFSESNFFAYDSSTNYISKGKSGLCFLNIASIFAKLSSVDS